MLIYQILATAIHQKREKIHIETIHLQYLLQRGMINLNCLRYHISYQAFNIILSISSENMMRC